MSTSALAQDPPPAPAPDGPTPAPTPPPGPTPAPPAPSPTIAELDARVRALEADLDRARVGAAGDRDDWECEECDDEDDHHQFQLRGGWFNLQHNHHDELRKNDGHQNGWSFGAGIVLQLWDLNEDDDGHPGRREGRRTAPGDDSDRDGFDDDGDGQVDEDHRHHDHRAIDLCAYMTLEYRQVEGDEHYRSIVNGDEGTISYLNAVVAPMIRFEATELVRPFFMAGANMQLVSPAEDEDSHLDLGLLLGVGVDLRVHEHVSIGLDYRYTWFGVADQDDEDYGQLSAYLGFNF